MEGVLLGHAAIADAAVFGLDPAGTLRETGWNVLVDGDTDLPQIIASLAR